VPTSNDAEKGAKIRAGKTDAPSAHSAGGAGDEARDGVGQRDDGDKARVGERNHAHGRILRAQQSKATMRHSTK
jgi:hypothetical protein